MFGSIKLFEDLGRDEFVGLFLGKLCQAGFGHLIKTGAVLLDDGQEQLVPQDGKFLFNFFELEQVICEDS